MTAINHCNALLQASALLYCMHACIHAFVYSIPHIVSLYPPIPHPLFIHNPYIHPFHTAIHPYIYTYITDAPFSAHTYVPIYMYVRTYVLRNVTFPTVWCSSEADAQAVTTCQNHIWRRRAFACDMEDERMVGCDVKRLPHWPAPRNVHGTGSDYRRCGAATLGRDRYVGCWSDAATEQQKGTSRGILTTSIIILHKMPAPDRKEREHISEWPTFWPWSTSFRSLSFQLVVTMLFHTNRTVLQHDDDHALVNTNNVNILLGLRNLTITHQLQLRFNSLINSWLAHVGTVGTCRWHRWHI